MYLDPIVSRWSLWAFRLSSAFILRQQIPLGLPSLLSTKCRSPTTLTPINEIKVLKVLKTATTENYNSKNEKAHSHLEVTCLHIMQYSYIPQKRKVNITERRRNGD